MLNRQPLELMQPDYCQPDYVLFGMYAIYIHTYVYYMYAVYIQTYVLKFFHILVELPLARKTWQRASPNPCAGPGEASLGDKN